MSALLPKTYMLTCRPRYPSAGETLNRWKQTDWGAKPVVHVDAEPERAGEEWGRGARARRLTDAFAGMLRTVLADGGEPDEWLLFLEDDLEFHPRIGSLVRSWAALDDAGCVLASLFNPSLRAVPGAATLPRAFVTVPETFLGAQALLLRRRVLPLVLEKWDSVPGLQSQRLARILGDSGRIWVHKPSLVQHVAVDSSWGARVQRALDFDPTFQG